MPYTSSANTVMIKIAIGRPAPACFWIVRSGDIADLYLLADRGGFIAGGVFQSESETQYSAALQGAGAVIEFRRAGQICGQHCACAGRRCRLRPIETVITVTAQEGASLAQADWVTYHIQTAFR